jgi:mannosyltransferase
VIVEAARGALAVLRRHWGLVALIVSAALLRFSTLDAQSFWQDEAVTAELIHPRLLQTLSLVPASETTPPLYYLLAWLWSQLFGTGEVGLRSLSALLGTATIPVAYAAAVPISRRVGLVAGALSATNPMLVWYSQEARAYSLLVFLAALSFVFFERALQRPTRGSLIGWALSSALALATHYFAILLVAPEAVWLLARSPRRRPAVAAVAATATAGLGLLPLALTQARAGHAAWIATIDLGERLKDAWQNFLVGGGPGQIDALVAPTSALAGAGLLLLGLRAQGVERRIGLIALAIGATVIVGALVLAGFGPDYLLDRNLLPALVPLTVALAAGFGARRAGPVGLACAGALCALFTLSVALTASRKDLQRPDWRGVAVALGEGHVPRVIVTPASGDLPLQLYLRGARDAVPGAVFATEVIVINAPGPERLTPSLPPGFVRAQRQTIAGFVIATFRSRRAAKLMPRALSTSAATAEPVGVLIEGPTRPTLPKESGGSLESLDAAGPPYRLLFRTVRRQRDSANKRSAAGHRAMARAARPRRRTHDGDRHRPVTAQQPTFALMARFVAKGLEKTCRAGIFTGRPLPNGKPAPFLRTDHIFYYSPHLRGPQRNGII